MIVRCNECCRVFHEGDLCSCVQCGSQYCLDCLIDDHCIECAQEYIEDKLRDVYHCCIKEDQELMGFPTRRYIDFLDWTYKKYSTKELFRYDDFDYLLQKWLSEKVSLPENKEGIAGKVQWVVT